MDEQEYEYMTHLETAHAHTQRAVDMLYKRNGVKRGTWYRITLCRAQSILLSLIMLEHKRKGKHENE